jgi:preprotein translocase subunit YajC
MPSPLLTSDLLLAQNVPQAAPAPPAGAPHTGQDSAPPSGGPGGGSSPLGGFMMPLIMLLVFVPIFFMMSRRQKKEQEARSKLKKGDRIMSNSGLVGELMEMDDKLAKVKIAPGVTVTMVANTISALTAEAEKAAPKELKEAKAVSDKK